TIVAIRRAGRPAEQSQQNRSVANLITFPRAARLDQPRAALLRRRKRWWTMQVDCKTRAPQMALRCQTLCCRSAAPPWQQREFAAGRSDSQKRKTHLGTG